MHKITKLLSKIYSIYKETSFEGSLYLPHSLIIECLEKHSKSGVFEFSVLGKSAEDIDINCFKYGNGKKKILLWSQMHGDESTGTQAIFDIMNFLSSDNHVFEKKRKKISKKCTLYFIPMLNPDGANRFTRRNALGIDINRDARKLASPEAQILMNAVKKISPDFAFNLHDQDAYYSVGKTSKPAAISFLSPTYNQKKSVNKSRKRSMKIISMNNELIQKYVPGSIAKYNDDFYPTAFGDNIQRLGISTILIESGWYYNDDNKQLIRKLNYLIILNSIFSISTNKYKKYSVQAYSEIPFNRKDGLFEKILKHKIQIKDKEIETDIGIRRRFTLDENKEQKCEYKIEDIGDLSAYYQYIEEEFNVEISNFISIGDKIQITK